MRHGEIGTGVRRRLVEHELGQLGRLDQLARTHGITRLGLGAEMVEELVFDLGLELF